MAAARHGRRARMTASATLIAAALVGAGCAADRGTPNVTRLADERTGYAVQRLALDSLFSGREHASRLVLWSTDAADGPVLEAVGVAVVRPKAPRVVDVTKLAPSLPARVMDEATLTALFRRYPDAWAEFFREHPGAAGLVELAPVVLSDGGRTARTYVGRSCGEHCWSAWQLTARRDASGRWRLTDLHWVRLPPT
jgi:hypothetical protein